LRQIGFANAAGFRAKIDLRKIVEKMKGVDQMTKFSPSTIAAERFLPEKGRLRSFFR
jgi:hypothetical protein